MSNEVTASGDLDKKQSPGEFDPASNAPIHVYALLVGIDDYNDDSAPFGDLSGCRADVNMIEKFLKRDHYNFKVKSFGEKIKIEKNSDQNTDDWEHTYNTFNIETEGYGSLNICRLDDEAATYQGIINAFTSFLTKAKENDRVWFHFSGHGTETPTAVEFMNIENGKDNCLVCQDFREDDQGKATGLLADKELAQLLCHVNDKSNPHHMLVTLDCCNSGTGTRNENRINDIWGNRGQSIDMSQPRPISSYYGYEKGDTKYLPPPPHMVLTACTDLELAGDSNSGGAFTTSLIKALENTSGKINYPDLHTRTRFFVTQKRHGNQTPQFDAIGNCNAYSLFLDGSPDGDPAQYPVEYKEYSIKDTQTEEVESGASWLINCGILHHLPAQAKDRNLRSNPPIQVSVYQRKNPNTPVWETEIEMVGPIYSTLLIPPERKLIEKDGVWYDELDGGILLDINDPTYYGVINHIPAPKESVKIYGGDTEAIKTVKKDWTDKARSMNIHYLEEGDLDQHTLEISANNGEYALTDLRLKNQDSIKYTVKNVNALVDNLITIVKWHRFKALRNDRSVLKEMIQFDIEITGKESKEKELEASLSEGNGLMTLNFSKEYAKKGRNGFYYSIKPKVLVTPEHETSSLYFYLMVQYQEDYSVDLFQEKNDQPNSGHVIFKETKASLNATEDEYFFHFKLIVTTFPLDYHQLLLKGINGPRGPRAKLKDFYNPEEGLQDWWVIDKTLKLIKKP